MFDIHKVRADFPILQKKIRNKPLVYLDNAATTQKPNVVIQAIEDYYHDWNANIHRGIHTLAEKATFDYEATRNAVRDFLGAKESAEIIFTRGVTESINMVAFSYGSYILKPGDEVLISTMEHHSNIVPWQMACERTGAILKVIPIDEQGVLDLASLDLLINNKTKIVSIVHASNALGTINPIQYIIDKAHKVGAVVVVDGAQAASHIDIDVQALDADFYAFSGHKVYGPTGIGVLYGKRALLEAMPPYQGGGEMIQEVSFEKTTYNELPYKFEAGTPNIADTIALKAALEYIQNLGKTNIAAWENQLTSHLTNALSNIEGLKLIGKAPNKVSVVSFVVEGVHHQDIGLLLDGDGIAIRTGHHCTQPLMARYGLSGTNRASMSFYNTLEEMDFMVESLKKAVNKLK